MLHADQAFAAAAKALNQTEDALLNDPVLLPILLYHVLSVPVLVCLVGICLEFTFAVDESAKVPPVSMPDLSLEPGS